MKRLKRDIFTALMLVATVALFAQAEPVDLDMVHRIRQEGLKNSQIRDISFHLTDVIGPRLSGSTGLSNAYRWTSTQMEEWGLSNVQVAPWGEFGKGWENERFYIAMTKPYYQHLVAVPRAWTRGTDTLVVATPVLVNIQGEDDFDRYRGTLNGKVVVTPVSSEPELSFLPMASRWEDDDLEQLSQYPEIRSPAYGQPEREVSDWFAQRALNQKIIRFFEEEGVLAMLNPSGTFGTVRSHGRGYGTDVEPGMPLVDMTFEHYGRIVRLLEAGIEVELELDIRNRFLYDDLKGYNVLAEIPGTDTDLKDEVVIIGGHLDSWHAGTGGNDNASGIAVMMEVIRILKKIGVEPRRTIRIALWGAEEQGLHGSRNYVREHYFDPADGGKKPAHEKFSAYYNVDNGSGRIRGIYLQENDALRPIFEAWLEPLADLGVSTITLRHTGSTDHVAFDAAGLPAFQFIQDRLDYGRGYHTNMDTFERMQLGDMMQAATVVAVLVYHTAMRDEKLPRKHFDR
ncbi:MAG: M20/M25/M40 family metallo-hydrolase [Bacteroidales bacterium]